MSTTTEPTPTADELTEWLAMPDENETHIVWPCDENTALCGADVSGEEWGSDDWDEGETCPVCVEHDRKHAWHMWTCRPCILHQLGRKHS